MHPTSALSTVGVDGLWVKVWISVSNGVGSGWGIHGHFLSVARWSIGAALDLRKGL